MSCFWLWQKWFVSGRTKEIIFLSLDENPFCSYATVPIWIKIFLVEEREYLIGWMARDWAERSKWIALYISVTICPPSLPPLHPTNPTPLQPPFYQQNQRHLLCQNIHPLTPRKAWVEEKHRVSINHIKVSGNTHCQRTEVMG